ncbi:MAG: glucosamine-6-phosphate deaminase [Lentisphaeria bacterium]|nr:glucosamine-6-phosphate deaminase [Lentisphaeria bacterium]
MDVIVMPTAAAAAKLTAQIIADAINAKPNFKLGLATGRTMEPVYANLAKLNKANKVDFSRVTTFNLDEYVWPKKAKKYEANKDSYRYYMNYHLFNKINIDIRNTNVPDGSCDDVDAAAIEYDNAIAECGGLDIQLLGIGRSGHIGFNEPLSSFSSRTRAVTLTQTTYGQNSPLFDNPEDMPMQAVTMGVGTILEAKRLVFLATMKEKADIVAKAIEGPVTSMISATAMQMHEDVVCILDKDAASKLEGLKEYEWSFKHNPRWAAYQKFK